MKYRGLKIGIYGGSFNPIHNGHKKVVEYILERFDLDKIFIVPLGIPAHKEIKLESGVDRIEMCRLAFKNEEKVEVLDLEVKETKVSYTYDTLLKIKKLYQEAEIYEIMGEDSGENFESWKNYKDILKLSKIIILKRKGYKLSLKDENVIVLENPYYCYSSTEIRKKIIDGERIDELVPSEVHEYIEKKGLYKK